MKLQKYNYRSVNFPDFEDWVTDDINFRKLNLIVGKNATGKSRVVAAPTAFADMITQYKKDIYAGNWDFTFTKNKKNETAIKENKTALRYIINRGRDKKVTEKLFIDEELVLDRNKESTRLYSFVKKNFETVTPPDNKLVLHIRRDKEEYPYLEDIVSWAEQTHFFKFSRIHTTSFLGDGGKDERLVTVEDIPALIKNIDDGLKGEIIYDFNKLGYDIENLHAIRENGKDMLCVKERSLKYDLKQGQLSQGMFRALALIVFIHYITAKNNTKTIIVDDLGEGLDYERATNLGKLIFNKLEKLGMQFIASSNDSFLMDVVNIRYWSILARKDNMVKVYNYQNSKDKFDSFKYSGLSNFDLFSSDYLE